MLSAAERAILKNYRPGQSEPILMGEMKPCSNPR
jgi:hypothetical protein